MSQNDLVIANQTFPATRTDINSALQALGSLNSGATAPATTYANMLWYDTTNSALKMRSEANDQWISVGYLDQSDDAFRIFDNTQVVNSSGTQTGLIGDQATSAWEAGTSTTESLVSPAKVKAAIDQATSGLGIGVGQTWTDVSASRTNNTSYRNTTGKPIQIAITQNAAGSSGYIQVSVDSSTWVNVGLVATGAGTTTNAIVPDDHYYRTTDVSGILIWSELR